MCVDRVPAFQEKKNSIAIRKLANRFKKPWGTGFDVLDAAIETFGHGIGRAMSEIRQYTAKMTLEHLSDF